MLLFKCWVSEEFQDLKTENWHDAEKTRFREKSSAEQNPKRKRARADSGVKKQSWRTLQHTSRARSKTKPDLQNYGRRNCDPSAARTKLIKTPLGAGKPCLALTLKKPPSLNERE